MLSPLIKLRICLSKDRHLMFLRTMGDGALFCGKQIDLTTVRGYTAPESL